MESELHHVLHRIAYSIEELVRIYTNEISINRRFDSIENKLGAVQHSLNHMATAIAEFATRQNAFNDRIDTAVTGLTADVKSLNDLIEKLQNTSGAITPEDQALLNQIETRSDAIAAKLEALDALTPPVPPTA